MINNKMSYQELSRNIDDYLEKLNIGKDVNKDLNKDYVYEEIKNILSLIKENFKIETVDLFSNSLIIRNKDLEFLLRIEEEDNYKNISIFAAKLSKKENITHLVRDKALISIDKESADYTIKEELKDVAKEDNLCEIHSYSKTRNFTKEGLEKNKIVLSSKRLKKTEDEIDFYSFDEPLFISSADSVTLANRVYFDVFNCIELNNMGEEIYNGYQEIYSDNGYRKIVIKSNLLDSKKIRKLPKEEISKKLEAEKNKNIKDLLEKKYLLNRENFSYEKNKEENKNKIR